MPPSALSLSVAVPLTLSALPPLAPPPPPLLAPLAISASVVMPRRLHTPLKINTTCVHNRILALMAHTCRYAFKGESRLAHDAGVSKSAVSRLLNGKSSPSFALVSAITRALEPHLQDGLQGKRLDPHELISLDGTYPTASACELAGCRGCLPQQVYDAEGRLRPEFKGIQPGQWSVSPAAAEVNAAARASASGISLSSDSAEQEAAHRRVR